MAIAAEETGTIRPQSQATQVRVSGEQNFSSAVAATVARTKSSPSGLLIAEVMLDTTYARLNRNFAVC